MLNSSRYFSTIFLCLENATKQVSVKQSLLLISAWHGFSSGSAGKNMCNLAKWSFILISQGNCLCNHGLFVYVSLFLFAGSLPIASEPS